MSREEKRKRPELEREETRQAAQFSAMVDLKHSLEDLVFDVYYEAEREDLGYIAKLPHVLKKTAMLSARIAEDSAARSAKIAMAQEKLERSIRNYTIALTVLTLFMVAAAVVQALSALWRPPSHVRRSPPHVAAPSNRPDTEKPDSARPPGDSIARPTPPE